MEETWIYAIRVKGHLTANWAEWFEGLEITHAAAGETTLRGCFPDQAALLGALSKLHALNLALLSVERVGRT